MSEIISGKLFLGSLNDALNPLDVNTIISILDADVYEEIKNSLCKDIKHHIIIACDSKETDLTPFFHECFNLIDMKGNSVLVHCHLGISRSATLVISYLMIKYNYNLYEATKKVLEKRDYIFPNDSFIQQLISLDIKLHGKSIFLNDIDLYKKLLQGFIM